MESRRARLIIKAHLRGLFPERGFKYHIRSQARKEVILNALAAEEDAEIAFKTASSMISLLSCHINDRDNIMNFANK